MEFFLTERHSGLHFDNVARLLHVLNKLVEKGNTVLVIEHHPDLDY
jgi:excinuclease ABC subunit A